MEYEGVFSLSKGDGFVRIEGKTKDIFIERDFTKGAFHNDTVAVSLIDSKKGKITKILKRGTTQTVGKVILKKGKFYLKPDNPHLPILPLRQDINLIPDYKILVKLSFKKKITAFLTEVLGHKNDPGVDILSIIKDLNLPLQFSEEAMTQAESINGVTEPGKRLDLRDWEIFTIDDEDAKDLDDAISLTKEGSAYVLGVHIADVSHYVRENTPLDRDARKRGTSVYLADRVIPMLPYKLSNNICSLNPNTDRLALSCIMRIENGEVKNHEIHETIINVKKRMTYTAVAQILTEKPATDYKDFLPTLKLMAELAKILKDKRINRGALDFGLPEAKVILNRLNKPTDIVLRERNVATSMIEEFMLITNETIAQEYFWLDTPFIFRNHTEPDTAKLMELNKFIANFGYNLKGQKNHPKNLQKLLANLENTEEESIIQRVVLRSLKQARYSSAATGHFGLAADYYCHFTSPIRRYPDLMIHRIIKKNLRGQLNLSKFKNMEDIAAESSKSERLADEAARLVMNHKKAQFMASKVGRRFSGIISSVTSWGIYVELPNTIEGMVRLKDLPDDYYIHDAHNYRYVGESTGKVYSLGDKVKVRLLRAEHGKIDFVLCY